MNDLRLEKIAGALASIIKSSGKGRKSISRIIRDERPSDITSVIKKHKRDTLKTLPYRGGAAAPKTLPGKPETGRKIGNRPRGASLL